MPVLPGVRAARPPAVERAGGSRVAVPARFPLAAAVSVDLPSEVVHALVGPEVEHAVQPLLAAGWRPAQLQARIGALPASGDPRAAVLTLLQELSAKESPARRWARERAQRVRERDPAASGERATAAQRDHWIAVARRSLGAPARRAPAPPVRCVPPCASCGDAGTFFVRRGVRLCAGCVGRLETGEVRGGSGADVR